MRICGDFGDLLAHEVQNCDRAATSGSRDFARQEFLSSKSDHDVLAAGVVSDVIRVQIERYRLQKLKCAAVKDLYRAIAAA